MGKNFDLNEFKVIVSDLKVVFFQDVVDLLKRVVKKVVFILLIN